MVMVNTVVYVRDMLGGSEADVAMIRWPPMGPGSMVVKALSVPRLLTVITDRSVMLTGASVAAIGLLAAATVLVTRRPDVAGADLDMYGAAGRGDVRWSTPRRDACCARRAPRRTGPPCSPPSSRCRTPGSC